MEEKMLPIKCMSVILVVFLFSGLFPPVLHADKSVPSVDAGSSRVEVMETATELKFKTALNFAEARDWGKAAALLEELRKIDPTNIDIANNLAVVFFHQGRINKAQQLLAEILESNEETRTSFRNLQLLYGFVTAEAYRQGLGENKKSTIPELILRRSLGREIGLPQQLSLAVETPKAATAPLDTPGAKDLALPRQPVAKVVSDPDTLVVQEKLNNWAEAWSKGNSTDYIAFYSPDYHPVTRSRASWERDRQQKITPSRKIEVSLSEQNFSREPKTDRIIATFVQTYRASDYRDVVAKKMVWEQRAGEWFIVQEMEFLGPSR